MATADWGGTSATTPAKNGDYVYNPADFGGVTADQYEKSKQGIIASLGNPSGQSTGSQNSGASFGGSATSGTSSTSSSGIVSGQMQAAQVAAPTQWNVDAPQTVQGQIKDIINPNSPLMQQARTGALEQMNSRGLLNSSMAITAGDDAAYRAAVPIATADASTYAKSASYNADAQNQANLANAQLQNQAGQSNLTASTQTSIAKMNDDTQKNLANLDIQSRTNLQQLQNDNQILLNTNSQAASLFSNATSALNNIAMSTTMDGPAKQTASAQVWANLQSQFKVLSKTSGLNLSGTLGVDTSTNPYITPTPTADALKDKTKSPGTEYEWSDAQQSWVKVATPAATPATPANTPEQGGR